MRRLRRQRSGCRDPATISSGRGSCESASSTLCSPSSTSDTPVKPAWTIDRRGHAVARAHAGEVEGLLDVLRVALPAPEAGYLLRGVRERVAHLRLVERASDAAAADGAQRRAHAFGAAVRRPHANRVRAPSGSGSTSRSRARRRATARRPSGRRARPSRAPRARRSSPGCAFVNGWKSSVSSAWANMPLRERGVDRRRADVGRGTAASATAALAAHVADRHLAGLERARPRRSRRACRGCGASPRAPWGGSGRARAAAM